MAEAGQGGAQAGVGVVGDLTDLGAVAEADHGLGVDGLDEGVVVAGAAADQDVAGQQGPSWGSAARARLARVGLQAPRIT
ncbi:hypothetical protein BJEO58_01649 [Brevibacterium jeotgali]|uniref:Uncharacterized protein n=1 Tax=Brevibacterium jeotgali TaxID=1262550 RepID=A0A2H1L5P1_9MICO|nr:hypothetical protein BJEO58_01649 [Brevibacterium jeotgali]